MAEYIISLFPILPLPIAMSFNIFTNKRRCSRRRIEAVRTSVLHQLIDVTVEENTKVSLYFADYKEKNCQEVVDVIDVNTKRMLASYLLNNFEEGVYLSFGVSGNVQFRITRFFYDHYGNPDYPVCSAIFFDKE